MKTHISPNPLVFLMGQLFLQVLFYLLCIYEHIETREKREHHIHFILHLAYFYLIIHIGDNFMPLKIKSESISID